jgi:hypothetical protein
MQICTDNQTLLDPNLPYDRRSWERGRIQWDLNLSLERSRVEHGEMQRPDGLFFYLAGALPP